MVSWLFNLYNEKGFIIIRIIDENMRVADRVGFEPTVRFLAHTLSKRAP